MARRFQTPESCPVCGAAVPAGARACVECGADERTGWDDEKTRYDGLDLPDESFDYQEALRDSGLEKRRIPKGIPTFWWLVGFAVLAAITILALGSRF